VILTEEEAKTKTCPHVRYCENPHHVMQDHGPAIYSQSVCIGSHCMAWRWHRRGEVQTPFGIVPVINAPLNVETSPVPDLGFCGIGIAPKVTL
jgi:hypothetical protein